jgi:pyrroloquinoline quinone biosynthesis protein B
MRKFFAIVLLISISTCSHKEESLPPQPDVFLIVLGIAQDAGYPQAGCSKSCCQPVWEGKVEPEKVISLGLVDKPNNKVYLFDATPDFKEQLHDLLEYLPNGNISNVAGIFLTHAHIGHYTGLMHLGREAMGAKNVPVYAMPKMHSFLNENGPWSQLVDLNNIKVMPQTADSSIHLSNTLSVSPFLVPHRDEYSETVGYKISVNEKNAIFIPDIDKWHKWDKNIVEEVEKADYAFLDAAFYSEKELPNRNMDEIPHPFVPETIDYFKDSPDSIKNRIVFIHFNHTNPLLHNGDEFSKVLANGFNIGREHTVYTLD